MFGIIPENEPLEMDGELFQEAKIVIDDFWETLQLPLSYWELKDYKRSWLASIEKGMHSKNHAALAVSMYDPEQTNFIFVWVIYFQDDDVVFLQNKVIFLEDHPSFTIEKINDFITPRVTHTEDGHKISEWCTDLNSIVTFCNSLKE
ncbi:Uncharacterised protein [Yersinia thracica]|uniref:CdiI C-terminal domain-containing protein n=1 Tax=Yersinia thracica TaxID=2890319 RepID=A0A0T9R2M4_9GAMM|nr:hypothetical protein [Yersinia thracica]CNI41503.1 Uncharacterised protein [Yersinia thracica]